MRDVAVVNQQGTIVQAYDYDPYGNALQTPASGPMPVGNPLHAPAGGLTPDFRYAGMYYDSGSGLYLTRYRAYDPRTARWLSRDPAGEMNDLGPRSVSPETANPALATTPPLPPVDTFTPSLVALPGGATMARAMPDTVPTVITLPGAAATAAAVPGLVPNISAESDRSNLYLYVSADPMNLTDPMGLWCWNGAWTGAASLGATGFAWGMFIGFGPETPAGWAAGGIGGLVGGIGGFVAGGVAGGNDSGGSGGQSTTTDNGVNYTSHMGQGQE